MARRLPSFGYDPRVVFLRAGPFEDWLVDVGCPVEVLRMRRSRQLHRTAAAIERLRRLCRTVPVVLANQSKGQAIACTAAALSGTPCVWRQHGIASRSPIESVASTWPLAAVVCSAGEPSKSQKRLTPRRRVEVIHPGIDVSAIGARADSGREIRSSIRWTGPVVGMVARLQPWKGQELFLRAAALVARMRSDVRFAIVGGAILGWEGDYPQRLRALAAQLGIEDRVFLAGHQADVYPWFDALDLSVTASVGEPFGLVTVEALALRKPVVGVRSAGTAEIIEDGVSGLLVPPRRSPSDG